MLIIFLFSLVSCQKSPLQIGAQPFELTLDTTSPIEFSLRVYLSMPFTIIMHILNFSAWQPEGEYYIQFTSDNSSQLTFSQMVMQAGKLSPISGEFKQQSIQNAETYDQYRFSYVSIGSSFSISLQKIYRVNVYRDPSPDLSTFVELRSGFLHTFMSNTATIALLPENLFQFQDIVEGTVTITPKVFVNAIDYKSKATLMLAFLFNIAGSANFVSIQGGFSFSRSHIYRDMLRLSIDKSGQMSITDSFSLLAGAPYSDTSHNIGGQDNLNRILMIHKSNYILIMISRSFDTGDHFGDEIITKKTNLQYCLALNTKHLNKQTSQFSSIKHNFIRCFNPNINLWTVHLTFLIILIFYMF